MSCPAPFLSPNGFPSDGGYIAGRFCSNVTPELSCCLPCPTDRYLYDDDFALSLDVGFWLNVPSFICQIFLLTTFAVLPREASHRHYLSIGLCICFAFLTLSFIIPLGTKPDVCYNEITPNDMHTDGSCAVSGTFLSLGAMGIGVWLLLRSLWIHLRVCWDVRETKTLKWVANIVGFTLPCVFLGLSLGITGVSYRLSDTCVPNNYFSFLTWFGWLTAFGCLAVLIQLITTGFCFWLYLRDFLRGGSSTTNSTMQSSVGKSAMEINEPPRKKLAWKRVKTVLASQWRSVLLCILVAVSTIFYGTVFISTGQAVDAADRNSVELQQWALCLILNGGNKGPCGSVAPIVGINETAVKAVWPISGLTGMIVFILLIRRSMITGWYHMIRDRKRKTSIGEEGFLFSPPRQRHLGKPLESESKQQELDETKSPIDTPHADGARSVSPPSPLLPPPSATERGGFQSSGVQARGGSPYRAAELAPANLQERKLAPNTTQESGSTGHF